MPRELPLIACTLDGSQQGARLEEFRALFATNLIWSERNATGVTLTLDAANGAEATTRALFAKEKECCAFFDFTITSAGDEVTVLIEAPAEAAAAVDGFLTLARAAAR